MKNKVLDFVYLNTKTYLSIWQIAGLAIVFVFLSSFVLSVSIMSGSWVMSALILLFNIVYIAFVCKIFSKKTPKTFTLRFLVNGLCALFIALFFAIFDVAIIWQINKELVKATWWLWLVSVLFALMCIILAEICIHLGTFSKIRKFNKHPVSIFVSSVLMGMVPLFSILGMRSANRMEDILSESQQEARIYIGFWLVSLLSSLGYVNFLQYHYCKKYKIKFDENGCDNSPRLGR